MKLRTFLVCAFAAMLPAIAAAQQASTINPVAMRAGPDREYPLVASYGAGTPITVQGCTAGYAWCDVIGPNGYRGWVYAGDIGYPYQRRQVPVLGYGPAIGIPIVTFALAPYWAAHYPNRPWYHERARWERFHPVVAAVPGPGPAAVVVRPVRPIPRRAAVVAVPPPVADPNAAAQARGQ